MKKTFKITKAYLLLAILIPCQSFGLDLINLPLNNYNVNNYGLISHVDGLRRLEDGHSHPALNRAIDLIKKQEFNLCTSTTPLKLYPQEEIDGCLFLRHLEMLISSNIKSKQILIRFEERMFFDYMRHFHHGIKADISSK